MNTNIHGGFIDGKNCKLPVCPSMNEWLNDGTPIIWNTFSSTKRKNSIYIIIVLEHREEQMKNRLWVAEGRVGRGQDYKKGQQREEERWLYGGRRSAGKPFLLRCLLSMNLCQTVKDCF